MTEATGGQDPELVVAALLHDAIEDCDILPAEIAARFGEGVAGLVLLATDDKSLPKQVRKQRQIETAPHKPLRAKMLKLADKTSNLRALAASPPADWPMDRRLDYIVWARAVAAGLRGAHPWLEAQFDQAAAAAEHATISTS